VNEILKIILIPLVGAAFIASWIYVLMRAIPILKEARARLNLFEMFWPPMRDMHDRKFTHGYLAQIFLVIFMLVAIDVAIQVLANNYVALLSFAGLLVVFWGFNNAKMTHLVVGFGAVVSASAIQVVSGHWSSMVPVSALYFTLQGIRIHYGKQLARGPFQ
jgi:hypothetical protein